MQQPGQTLPRAAPSRAPDPRWHALGIVQSAMQALALRDRDIAVLRGLLSFIPAEGWEGALVVYASNAALQGRCDGIDERTLRRRLARLAELGLIRRNPSPNRKRYVVRDASGAPVLIYGFDLTPLRDALPRLQALGEAQARARQQIAALKAVLRDRLYRLSQPGFRPEIDAAALAAHARLLRRKASIAELEAAIAALAEPEETPTESAALASQVTGSDGQNDRHIQSSHKEYLERKSAREDREKPAEPALSVEICIEAARSSVEFAQEPPRSWADLARLAHQLAPAIGVDPQQMQRTRALLGERGASLAILGLVEAYPRIRQPKRYLNSLLTRAAEAGLNMERMFRSLTGWSRFPAGNRAGALA